MNPFRMKKTSCILIILFALIVCKNNSKNTPEAPVKKATIYPSDVISFMDEWKILLGDGTYRDSLVNYAKQNFFYVETENATNWVVYKTPNAGIT